jgi:hypothetical protein
MDDDWRQQAHRADPGEDWCDLIDQPEQGGAGHEDAERDDESECSRSEDVDGAAGSALSSVRT